MSTIQQKTTQGILPGGCIKDASDFGERHLNLSEEDAKKYLELNKQLSTLNLMLYSSYNRVDNSYKKLTYYDKAVSYLPKQIIDYIAKEPKLIDEYLSVYSDNQSIKSQIRQIKSKIEDLY